MADFEFGEVAQRDCLLVARVECIEGTTELVYVGFECGIRVGRARRFAGSERGCGTLAAFRTEPTLLAVMGNGLTRRDAEQPRGKPCLLYTSDAADE